jgi:hypothetical protein
LTGEDTVVLKFAQCFANSMATDAIFVDERTIRRKPAVKFAGGESAP